ncbi:MAG TPA: amidohydrolase family protein, partial [Candidatus Wallbacteria bacterium]|nr:amidohydrolase family protein [Candidatus Wallbacteria bacterium]
EAKKVIDARGFIVAPGFIDVHNHSDMLFNKAGDKRYMSLLVPAWKGNYNYITQGVTTIVTGLCGQGYADTDKWLGLAGLIKYGTNVYHLIPYGEIRTKLFGKDQPRELTPDQLESLKKNVEQQMKNGAIGVSVGLEYAPDCFTTTDELVEIAKVVNKYGGVYVAHIRDNTGTLDKKGVPGVLTAIRETVEIGRRAKAPVHISHIQLNLPWNSVEAKQMYGLIEKARREGIDITADQHPYEAGYAVLSYRLADEFKSATGVVDKYKTPEGRLILKKEAERIFSFLGPEKIMITFSPAEPKYTNKTIADIAKMENSTPAEAYVSLCCMDSVPFALFFEISEEVNRGNMPHDYVFTVSDGYTVFRPGMSPHPRFYGCFPHKIRKYAIEEKLMSVNDAIRSMTSLPAKKFGLKGRGMIAPGNFADIAVIDLKNFTDRATYRERELYSTGVMYLLINGVISIESGKITGRSGGRPLKLIKDRKQESDISNISGKRTAAGMIPHSPE